jgi:uncharacterized protein YjdB
MTGKFKIWSLFLAAALVLAGCGGDGGSDTVIENTPLDQPGVNTGIAAFEFFLARAVPSEVDIIEFYGFDENGTLVFGPAPRNKAAQIVLENLPLYLRSFRLDYYDGDFLVGQGEVPVLLSPNGRVSINDPDFDDVTATSLTVTPQTAQITLGTGRNLNATVSLSNGDSFSVTEEATYTSNSAAVTVDSRGRITGAALGSATITVTYRGLVQLVQIEVISAAQ